jgi:hypothetical protein
MNLRRLSGGLSLWVLFSGSLLWGQRVRVADGTPVPVRLKNDLRANQVGVGYRVDFVVARPVMVQGWVAIPAGSVAWGAIQSVKKDKEIKFDVQGLRLANLQEIRLRSVPEKTSNPGKDQIKLTSMLGDVVGASMGTEFMAYLDEDIQVKAAPAEETPAPAPPPAAVPAKPVEVTPTPAETAPQAAQPAESAPPVPAAVTQTPQPLAPAGQQPAGTGERVTVECFSDPTGADILIDGSFYGSTPSILKLTATAHHLEISMQGYKNYVQDLDLSGERGFRTIRAPLEKKEQE